MLTSVMWGPEAENGVAWCRRRRRRSGDSRNGVEGNILRFSQVIFGQKEEALNINGSGEFLKGGRGIWNYALEIWRQGV